jgi:hypothetical protein
VRTAVLWPDWRRCRTTELRKAPRASRSTASVSSRLASSTYTIS